MPPVNQQPGLLAAAAIAVSAAPVAWAADVVTEPFEGVRLIAFTRTLPRQLHGFLLDIDLSAPGLSFAVTPSNGALEGETTRQTTLQFVRDTGVQAAINGDFFATYGAQAGLSSMNASAGDLYSPWPINDTRPALNITPDNVATIVTQDLRYNNGVTPTPMVPIFNAVGGNRVILRDGVVVATDTALAPRTASGTTDDGRLLLMVVDGRRAGWSDGVSTAEAGELLRQFGATHALNHDGGGSTTMVLAAPTAAAVNRPSDNTMRSVGNNLGVRAGASLTPMDTVVFASFAGGDEGPFTLEPGYSGSTLGIDKPASSATAIPTGGAPGVFTHDDGWAQRLVITDDAARPGAWFVRHVAGSGASRAQNLVRPTTGAVGVWARTNDAGVRIALALDDADDVTADRGVFRDVIADGEWHLYEWSFADAAQWRPWINGDGVIDTASFTIDSIQLTGIGDVVVDLDNVTHNALGRVGPPVPEPGVLGSAGLGGLALLTRRRRDRATSGVLSSGCASSAHRGRTPLADR